MFSPISSLNLGEMSSSSDEADLKMLAESMELSEWDGQGCGGIQADCDGSPVQSQEEHEQEPEQGHDHHGFHEPLHKERVGDGQQEGYGREGADADSHGRPSLTPAVPLAASPGGQVGGPRFGTRYSLSLVRHRDGAGVSSVGLGMTVVLSGSKVLVHKLPRPSASALGPAERAGVREGDELVGVAGFTFLQSCILDPDGEVLHKNNDGDILREAVRIIQSVADPVLLHFSRSRSLVSPPLSAEIHPFSSILSSMGLIKAGLGEEVVSRQINLYSSRTSRWEGCEGRVINVGGAPEESKLKYCSLEAAGKNLGSSFGLHGKARLDAEYSSPHSTLLRPPQFFDNVDYLNHPRQPSGPFSVSLEGCRKHLGVRVVSATSPAITTLTSPPPSNRSSATGGGEHSNCETYNLWVQDVSTELSWNVNKKTFQDFKDLRSALTLLRPSIGQVPFPRDVETAEKQSFFSNSKPASNAQSLEVRRSTLEKFLRKVTTLMYTSNLHPNSGPIMQAVQSFLGCQNMHFDVTDDRLLTPYHCLRRAVQCYTARLFLLPILDITVTRFVESTKSCMPNNSQIVALVKTNRREELKRAALAGLKRVSDFLQRLQDAVLEGCSHDLCSLRSHPVYSCVSEEEATSALSDGVRRQIEAEVYVPLRGLLSRVLVNAYRKEDVELSGQLKMLAPMDQTFYKIPLELQSPSNWERARNMLKEGIGKSTLPCDKLDAIVRSAGEIVKIFEEERSCLIDVAGGKAGGSGKTIALGADDFLPIFISCVVRSSLDRMVSLSVLVEGMCEGRKKIGEAGYYMATFQATIEHIRDILIAEDGTLASPQGDGTDTDSEDEKQQDQVMQLEGLLNETGFLG